MDRAAQVRFELGPQEIERLSHRGEPDIVIDPSQHAFGAASLATRLRDRVEIIAHCRSPSLEGLVSFLRLPHNLGEGR